MKRINNVVLLLILLQQNLFAQTEAEIPDAILAHLTKNDTAESKAGQDYFLECITENLTNDSIADYIITTVPIGGPTYTAIYDGKTMQEIPYSPPETIIWSRPGIDIEIKSIDVYCEDKHKELLVRYGHGGTFGHYYSNSVYRFDAGSKTMKLIFEEVISAVDRYGIGKEPDIFQYIDINYSNEKCIEEIKIRTAQEPGMEDKAYELDLIPLENSSSRVFRFNVEFNEFVEIENGH